VGRSVRVHHIVSDSRPQRKDRHHQEYPDRGAGTSSVLLEDLDPGAEAVGLVVEMLGGCILHANIHTESIDLNCVIVGMCHGAVCDV
jgi:hypothetical protein